MEDIERRLEYFEEAHEALKIQNKVLVKALKGMLRGLPAELAQDVVESVQLAFEDAVNELVYEDSPHVDLFHDVTYAFFREKE